MDITDIFAPDQPMSFINIEIKARCSNPEEIEFMLMQKNADFIGIDHQVDTYFKVASGRLKLREGNIEHSLIQYNRSNESGPKTSQVTLYKPTKDPALKEILQKSLGVLTVVDKKRKIFFIDNVKFHIDDVLNLGSFVEIEAIDKNGSLGREKLQLQCDHFMKVLKIKTEDLISVSYSDLLLEKKK